MIYLTPHTSAERDPKENVLISKAQAFVVRKRFSTIDELKSAVYASLVHYLIDKEIIRQGPFDASLHPTATLEEIGEEKVRDFVRVPVPSEVFRYRNWLLSRIFSSILI